MARNWCECAECVTERAQKALDKPAYTQDGPEYLATSEGFRRVMTVGCELREWDGRNRLPRCTACGFPQNGGHADDCPHARPWQRSRKSR
jgi:hypothetical protein